MRTTITHEYTLATFVHRRFWNLLQPSLSHAVRRSYGTLLRRYIVPRMGAYKLQDVTDPVLKEFATSIAQLGLPPETMRSVFQVLKLVLEIGERHRAGASDNSDCSNG